MQGQDTCLPVNRKRISLVITVMSTLALTALFWYGPVSQEPSYNQFADQRTLFYVPNFWNVITNLPFVLVGMIGLYQSRKLDSYPLPEANRSAFIFFFAGILATGMTSANFHLWPENETLFWDRLTMAISFMAFLSIVIGAFISSRLGKRLLLPLVLFGLFSVVYWIVTEILGAGDLRLYIVTQFLTPILIAVIILFGSSETIRSTDILIIGTGYGFAKILESLDTQIYQSVMVSGHSLKHIAASFCAYWVLRTMKKNMSSPAHTHNYILK